jgi:uncharacterized protein
MKTFFEARQQVRDEGWIVLDCHGHIGLFNTLMIAGGGDVDENIRAMDASGIRYQVASPIRSILFDCRRGNEEMFAAVDRYPDRMAGYAVINPDLGPEGMLEEFERRRRRPGFAGLKLYPQRHAVGESAADPRYYPLYEAANDAGMIILYHTWGTKQLEPFYQVCKDFPRLTILLGHSGGPELTANEMAVDLATKFSGIHLDLTLSLPARRRVSWFLERVPAERILFGTDINLLPAFPVLGLLYTTPMRDEERRKILGENMMALLAAHAPLVPWAR